MKEKLRVGNKISCVVDGLELNYILVSFKSQGAVYKGVLINEKCSTVQRAISEDFYPKKAILGEEITENLRQEIETRELDTKSKDLRSKKTRQSCLILDDYDFTSYPDPPLSSLDNAKETSSKSNSSLSGTLDNSKGKSPIDSIRGLVESIDMGNELSIPPPRIFGCTAQKSKGKVSTQPRIAPPGLLQNDTNVEGNMMDVNKIVPSSESSGASEGEHSVDDKYVIKKTAGHSFLGSRPRVLKSPLKSSEFVEETIMKEASLIDEISEDVKPAMLVASRVKKRRKEKGNLKEEVGAKITIDNPKLKTSLHRIRPKVEEFSVVDETIDPEGQIVERRKEERLAASKGRGKDQNVEESVKSAKVVTTPSKDMKSEDQKTSPSSNLAGVKPVRGKRIDPIVIALKNIRQHEQHRRNKNNLRETALLMRRNSNRKNCRKAKPLVTRTSKRIGLKKLSLEIEVSKGNDKEAMHNFQMEKTAEQQEPEQQSEQPAPPPEEQQQLKTQLGLRQLQVQRPQEQGKTHQQLRRQRKSQIQLKQQEQPKPEKEEQDDEKEEEQQQKLPKTQLRLKHQRLQRQEQQQKEQQPLKRHSKIHHQQKQLQQQQQEEGEEAEQQQQQRRPKLKTQLLPEPKQPPKRKQKLSQQQQQEHEPAVLASKEEIDDEQKLVNLVKRIKSDKNQIERKGRKSPRKYEVSKSNDIHGVANVKKLDIIETKVNDSDAEVRRSRICRKLYTDTSNGEEVRKIEDEIIEDSKEAGPSQHSERIQIGSFVRTRFKKTKGEDDKQVTISSPKLSTRSQTKERCGVLADPDGLKVVGAENFSTDIVNLSIPTPSPERVCSKDSGGDEQSKKESPKAWYKKKSSRVYKGYRKRRKSAHVRKIVMGVTDFFQEESSCRTEEEPLKPGPVMYYLSPKMEDGTVCENMNEQGNDPKVIQESGSSDGQKVCDDADSYDDADSCGDGGGCGGGGGGENDDCEGHGGDADGDSEDGDGNDTLYTGGEILGFSPPSGHLNQEMHDENTVKPACEEVPLSSEEHSGASDGESGTSTSFPVPIGTDLLIPVRTSTTVARSVLHSEPPTLSSTAAMTSVASPISDSTTALPSITDASDSTPLSKSLTATIGSCPTATSTTVATDLGPPALSPLAATIDLAPTRMFPNVAIDSAVSSTSTIDSVSPLSSTVKNISESTPPPSVVTMVASLPTSTVAMDSAAEPMDSIAATNLVSPSSCSTTAIDPNATSGLTPAIDSAAPSCSSAAIDIASTTSNSSINLPPMPTPSTGAIDSGVLSLSSNLTINSATHSASSIAAVDSTLATTYSAGNIQLESLGISSTVLPMNSASLVTPENDSALTTSSVALLFNSAPSSSSATATPISCGAVINPASPSIAAISLMPSIMSPTDIIQSVVSSKDIVLTSPAITTSTVVKDATAAASNLTSGLSSVTAAARAAVDDAKNTTKTNVILIHKPPRTESGVRKLTESGESSNKKVLTMIDSAKLPLLMNSSHIQTLLADNTKLVVITNFNKHNMKCKSTSNDAELSVSQIANKDVDSKDSVTCDSGSAKYDNNNNNSNNNNGSNNNHSNSNNSSCSNNNDNNNNSNNSKGNSNNNRNIDSNSSNSNPNNSSNDDNGGDDHNNFHHSSNNKKNHSNHSTHRNSNDNNNINNNHKSNNNSNNKSNNNNNNHNHNHNNNRNNNNSHNNNNNNNNKSKDKGTHPFETQETVESKKTCFDVHKVNGEIVKQQQQQLYPYQQQQQHQNHQQQQLQSGDTNLKDIRKGIRILSHNLPSKCPGDDKKCHSKKKVDFQVQVDLEDVSGISEVRKHCWLSKSVVSGDIDLLCHETSVPTLDKVTHTSNAVPRKNRRKPLHVLKSLPNPAKKEMAATAIQCKETITTSTCHPNNANANKNEINEDTVSGSADNIEGILLDNVTDVRVVLQNPTEEVDDECEGESYDDGEESRELGKRDQKMLQRKHKTLAKKRQKALKTKKQRVAKKQRMDQMKLDQTVKIEDHEENTSGINGNGYFQLRKSVRQKTLQEQIDLRTIESNRKDLSKPTVDEFTESGDKCGESDDDEVLKDEMVTCNENTALSKTDSIKSEGNKWEGSGASSKRKLSSDESVLRKGKFVENVEAKQVKMKMKRCRVLNGDKASDATDELNKNKQMPRRASVDHQQRSEVYKVSGQTESESHLEDADQEEEEEDDDSSNDLVEEGDNCGSRGEEATEVAVEAESSRVADDLLNVMSVKKLRMRLWNPSKPIEMSGFVDKKKTKKKAKKSLASTTTHHKNTTQCDNLQFSSVGNTLPAFKVSSTKCKRDDRETENDHTTHSSPLTEESMEICEGDEECPQPCSEDEARPRKQQQQQQRQEQREQRQQQQQQQISSRTLSEPSEQCGSSTGTGKQCKRKKRSKSLGIVAYTSLLKPIQRDKNEIRRGDLVWGRCAGHGWWPGRVVSLVKSRREANVSWSYSNTNSVMPVSHLDLFLPHFKKRFASHKTGGYLKAVREAQQLWEQQFGLLESPEKSDSL